ncbi:MAG: sugar ABC transporter permease [Acidimicrobiia bacterium]|nr:sugar ABC transporter permease [Acidimicrobiia bacterium]
MDKVISTLLAVVIAIGVSAGIWVVANLVFNQARRNWRVFNAIIFASTGFLVGALLAGNRLTVGSTTPETGGFVKFIWLPVVAMVAMGALGIVLVQANEPRLRLIISSVAGVAIGVAIGLLIRETSHPAIDVGPLIGWTVGGVAVGGGLAALRKRNPLPGLLVGAALGFVLGGWGSADIGAGSVGEALVASVVPAALLGARYGLSSNPDAVRRARIDTGSRSFIFLVPALLFILATLVVPAIRTLVLSFKDRTSAEWVGLENYTETFQDRNTWNQEDWTNMFTSRLFLIGVPLLAIAVVVGSVSKKRTGKAVELGNPTMAPLLGGFFFVAFAAFTAFRGTIANNLWWVLTVVFAATSMGLTIAVLADRSKHEKLAKSLIFMPLAISLVGASVIWRFVYAPRDASQEQTGLFNAVWVGLGRLSTGSGLPTIIIAVVLGLILLGLLVLVARALVRREWGAAVVPGIFLLLLGWFFIRYVTDGVGGFVENEAGVVRASPIGFVQESPFNNVWLMVILIWIQTGFAMVILSAAIKAVPDELLEAARVDGATQSQIFWRVTLPQIATTIGVVVTTLIVIVMKVFDIVKVVTNGQFDTQVLANDMFNEAFSNFNIGRGAALAMVLFVSVLPVMVFNIRKMQREG